MRKVRPYLFYDTTAALCSTCLRRVEAKILIKDNNVFMDKWCPSHGMERVLVCDDAEYYRLCREVCVKAPELPADFATRMRHGCPFDCGLCPDHMQHSCLSIVEITDHCNLECPVCYAASGPSRTRYRTLEQVYALLDTVVRSEGEADVVQISGGEPTLHPDLFAILARARAQALENLNEFDVSTTLVATLQRGVNDDQVGEILAHALAQPCVRGVTFQPAQSAGRTEGIDPARAPLTVSEVRRAIATQSGLFRLEDVLPVPCNPDTLAMAYALKLDGQVQPLTRFVDLPALLAGTPNTIVYEPTVRAQLMGAFATNHSPQGQADCLSQLLCCLPQVAAPSGLTYRNVFRVLVVQFMDARNLDIRALKKSCVHIATDDGRMIPFEAYNLFYREGAAGAQQLAKVLAEA